MASSSLQPKNASYVSLKQPKPQGSQAALLPRPRQSRSASRRQHQSTQCPTVLVPSVTEGSGSLVHPTNSCLGSSSNARLTTTEIRVMSALSTQAPSCSGLQEFLGCALDEKRQDTRSGSQLITIAPQQNTKLWQESQSMASGGSGAMSCAL